MQFGGPVEDSPGYDLTGLAVGCEGTFGICTKAWVRLTPDPQSWRTLLGVFESVDDASRTIGAIIAAGIVPAALEMMDDLIIRAVEEAFHFGFPLDAGAVLIIEVDGLDAGLDDIAAAVTQIARSSGAREVRQARTAAERDLLWKSRKKAFGAIGRLSPSYCCQDGVVPRSKIPQMLRFIRAVSQKHDLRIANVFHAGDGNMHPILLFDERDADQIRRVVAASREILAECIRLGGSVTGEHGIGVEKIGFMNELFSTDDLETMTAIREVFNPVGLCNPGKMLPAGGHCVELNLPARRQAT
jgi:glycolate oxidase